MTCPASALAFVVITAGAIYDADGPRFEGRTTRLEPATDGYVDAPEIGDNAECPLEHRRGIAARDRLRELAPIRLCVLSERGYYGRHITRAWTTDGVDVTDILLAEGHLTTERDHDWCAS